MEPEKQDDKSAKKTEKVVQRCPTCGSEIDEQNPLVENPLTLKRENCMKCPNIFNLG